MFAGYLAVYRICFVVTVFFLFMSVIMIGVRNSRDPRAGIQNGFWGFKYLIIIAGCIGAFFIPHGNFGPTWMYFGMVGGFMFIIIQLVLIIDFAHSWAESWQDNHCNDNSQYWFYALLSVTGMFYLATLVGIILAYSYYTGNGVGQCKLHEFFITFNMILCVIASATSVLPIIQEHQPNSGLLQSSFVSLYIIYLTWSAMANTPNPNCKLDLAEKVDITPRHLFHHPHQNPIHNNNIQVFGSSHNVTRSPLNGEDDGMDGPSMDTSSIIGLLVWFACVLYSSIKSTTNSQAARITMTDTVSCFTPVNNNLFHFPFFPPGPSDRPRGQLRV